MKTINIPTKNIYEFECDLDLLERAFEDFKTHKIEWVENVQPGQDYGSLTPSGYLDSTKKVPWYHEELFDWMQSCLDEVAKLTVKVPLAMCDSWTTKAEYKQKTAWHVHTFSVFSGLLYFTDHEQSHTMFEYNEHNLEKFGRLFEDHRKDKLQFKPEKGKFLLFPSDLFHSVQSHSELKHTRYTLAINTFFDKTLSFEPTAVLEYNVVTVKDRYLKWKAEQGQ
jgi:hypothetical protein